MDGPWQTSRKNDEEYGRLANETAHSLPQFDPALEIIAGGSSGVGMPGFPDWDRVVLDHCYGHVDALSIHIYAGADGHKSLADYLACPVPTTVLSPANTLSLSLSLSLSLPAHS